MNSPLTSNAAALPDQDSSVEASAATQGAREGEALSQLRWRMWQLVLVLGSLAMGLQAFLMLLASESVTYSFGLLVVSSAWFALCAILQGTLRRASLLIERLSHLGALALFLNFYTRIMIHIFAGTRPPGDMGEIFPWFAPVFTIAFIIYGGRVALAICSGAVLYTSGLCAFFISRALLGSDNIIALEASLDLFAANTILLLMLFFLRRATEAWAKTQARAETFAKLANRDALTGLYNRRYLNATLQEEVERARRYMHPLSVALCDIDDFKGVNDRFSHTLGDEVLQEVAHILEMSLRSVDTVVRYGGEEFVLVFPETEAVQARTVCEKVRYTVAHHAWAHLHPELEVTISIGVAGGIPKNPDQLLSAADLKLYEAKRLGRNQVCL